MLNEKAIWYGMKSRCYNQDSAVFKRYGGRGIKISDEWLNSFDQFYKDMGPRPNSEYSIDRIDNDGNYCKENCRWVTRIEQHRNTSKTNKDASDSTKVFAIRLTDSEKQLADEKHRDLEKQFNLKLTFTDFIKWVINNSSEESGVK